MVHPAPLETGTHPFERCHLDFAGQRWWLCHPHPSQLPAEHGERGSLWMGPGGTAVVARVGAGPGEPRCSSSHMFPSHAHMDTLSIVRLHQPPWGKSGGIYSRAWCFFFMVQNLLFGNFLDCPWLVPQLSSTPCSSKTSILLCSPAPVGCRSFTGVSQYCQMS